MRALRTTPTEGPSPLDILRALRERRLVLAHTRETDRWHAAPDPAVSYAQTPEAVLLPANRARLLVDHGLVTFERDEPGVTMYRPTLPAMADLFSTD